MLSSGVARAAIAFASNLCLVRFIAPERFGEFALALATIGMFETLVSLRVGIQVLRLRDDELDAESVRTYRSVLLYEIAIAGALSALWLSWLEALTPWSGLLIAGMLTQHWFGHTVAFYERQQPYQRLATIEGGSALLAHALAASLVLLGAGAAALYLREFALGVALVAALAASGGLGLERPRWLGLADWRRVFREVRGLWLEGVLEGTFERAPVLLVGAIGSTAAAGFFYQARRLATVPRQLLLPVTGRMAVNWLSRDGSDAARRQTLRRLLSRMALPLAAVGALCLATADWVVPFLLGKTWQPAARLLMWLVGVVVFCGLFDLAKSYLLALRQVRLLLVARVLQWLALLIPLAPWLFGADVGIESVALGLSLSYAVAFAVTLGLATHSRDGESGVQ